MYKTANNIRQLKVDYQKHLREKELVRQLKEKKYFDKNHNVVSISKNY